MRKLVAEIKKNAASGWSVLLCLILGKVAKKLAKVSRPGSLETETSHSDADVDADNDASADGNYYTDADAYLIFVIF